jgi:ribosomal protein S18 acetylase RimI-like enzyme
VDRRAPPARRDHAGVGAIRRRRRELGGPKGVVRRAAREAGHLLLLLLLAFDGSAAIGYGLAHVMAVEDSWIPDTWQTGQRIGEVESLSVLPEYRGSGLGSVLLDRLEAHLRARGARDLILGVLPGNDDAIRLYQRRGYRPTWLYLSRFEGRD